MSRAAPLANFGTARSATVTRSFHRYYLAFNTVLPKGARATKAVLHLTPLSSGGGALEVFDVPGDPYAWESHTLTWRTQPAPGSKLARTSSGFTAHRPITVSLPVAALQAGDTDLRIGAVGRRTRVSIATNEHPVPAYRPRLVVNYVPATTAPGTTPAATPTATPAPPATPKPTSSPSAPPAVPTPTAPTAAPGGHVLTGIPRYVSPSGSDSGDGSLSRPWRTWAAGLTHLRSLGAGHTLVLRGGVYTESFSGESPKGTAAQRVRITSYPGETAVIRGLTRLHNPDYLTIDHLTLESRAGEDPTQHMFRLTNGIGWVVEHNEFRNLRSFTGIHVVSWERADRPAAAQIRSNTFHDQFDARPAVNNNTQHFVYAGAGANGSLSITRNLFYRGANTGGAIKVGPNSYGPVDISYNTFFQNAPYSISFENTVNNTRIHRNILVAAGSSHLQLWNYQGDGSRMYDNLWWGQNLLTYGGWTTAAEHQEVMGTGNISADPQFADAARGDFRPRNPGAGAYGRYAP